MHDPLGMHPDVRVLETRDTQPTPVAVREKRERVAGILLEDRIVVAA